MVSITIPLEEFFKQRLNTFIWVNWSEVGREEMLKREIFDRYLKTHELSDSDNAFCEEIDWHPVDELPMKEEFIEELKKSKAEQSIKLKSVSDIFK